MAGLEGKRPKVVLVFDNVQDRPSMLAGVAQVFDPTIVFGCSTYGPITEAGNQGSVGVLALAGDFSAAIAVADAGGDLKACGRDLAVSLKKAAGSHDTTGQLLILFGKCHVPANDDLTAGAREVLGDAFPIVGGAASEGELVYYQGKILKESNVGVLLSGPFSVGLAMHGPQEPQAIIDSAQRAVEEATAQATAQSSGAPSVVFAFDCGGRRGTLGDQTPRELAAMRKALAAQVPLFGFYGSGEIGPPQLGAPSRGVGFHVSVCAITPAAP